MEILIFWLLHVDRFLFPIRVRRLHYLHGPTSLHRHMYLSIGPPNSHEQRESQKGGGGLPLKPVSICRVSGERIGQRPEGKTLIHSW
jgi:hypothetical protein